MKEKLILIGDGSHALIVLENLSEMNAYENNCVTSKNETRKKFKRLPVLGRDSVLTEYFKQGLRNVAIGIGGFTDNQLREKIYKKVKSIGFNVVSAIHPSAIISKSASIGEGNTLFAGVVINAEVVIGNNCIIATNSSIDHETIINDHVLISAGVTIGANSIIETGTLCALGSKVISNVRIGKNTLVAAGAVVVNNINDNSKVFGIPAIEKKTIK